MAGYNPYTDSGNIRVENFTFLAIKNLSDSGNVDWKWSPDSAANRFYRLLPLDPFSFPILGTAYEQVYIYPDGEISIFTDGKIVPESDW